MFPRRSAIDWASLAAAAVLAAIGFFWCSISLTLPAVASTALPCGMRKLRPNPGFTSTSSPALPRLCTSSLRMTCIVGLLSGDRERHERDHAGALDGRRHFALMRGAVAAD